MTAAFNNAQASDKERFAQQATGQRLGEPRITPVEKGAWSPEQKQLLEPLEQAGNLYNVFTTFANHAELVHAWWPFANYVLRANSLSARDREILEPGVTASRARHHDVVTAIRQQLHFRGHGVGAR